MPQQKPKKLAGAVPMFGGLDPFAAKKALRSASKEESQCKFNFLFSRGLFSITFTLRVFLMSIIYSEGEKNMSFHSFTSFYKFKEKTFNMFQ